MTYDFFLSSFFLAKFFLLEMQHKMQTTKQIASKGQVIAKIKGSFEEESSAIYSSESSSDLL